MTDVIAVKPAADRVPSTGRFRIAEWLSIAALVIADQLSKLLVVRSLPLHDSVTVIPGVLDFTYVQNTGAAFGFLNAVHFPGKAWALTGMALVALVAITMYALRFGGTNRLSRWGIVLIVSGAIGNLIDRARLGFVVDFVDVYWREWHFWAFNVADAAITIGAIALLLDVAIGGHDAS